MNRKSKIKNLWGELPVKDSIRTPYIILKEQAFILNEATNQLLIGHVEKIVLKRNPSYDFECVLEIKAPSINNYSISVVEIKYPITIYPLIISSQVAEDSYQECRNETELNQILEKILSSSEVKRVVLGLLSEVRADKVRE